MLVSGPAVPFQSHCISMSPFVLSSAAFAQAENTLPHGLCFGARVPTRITDLASAATVAVTNEAASAAAASLRIIFISTSARERSPTEGPPQLPRLTDLRG